MRASWIIASLLLTALMGGAAMAQEEARPNFLFIFSDDHAPHAIGAYGTRYAAVDPTPNIDRLAIEGRKFTDAHIPQGRTDERSYRKSQNRPWETNRA